MKFHLPTEQFGFIEVEYAELLSSPLSVIKEAIDAYKSFSEAIKAPSKMPQGLSDREFNRIYDELRITGKVVGDPGVIGMQMNQAQRTSINELKKSIKRAQVIK